jgi:hypothetical protein
MREIISINGKVAPLVFLTARSGVQDVSFILGRVLTLGTI